MDQISWIKVAILILTLLLVPNSQAQTGMPPIAPDLSNVVNLEEFSSGIKHYTRQDFNMSDAQKLCLTTNGFVVVPSDAEQFFHIYESSHYGMLPRIPNFITSDCLLQLYHLLYGNSLSVVEYELLLPELRELTKQMLIGTLRQYDELSDETLRTACMGNIAFFGVAVSLLGGEVSGDFEELLEKIEAETQLIKAHNSRTRSVIFPYDIDYTQFIPRGHYTRSEELEQFFQTMVWFGQCAFPIPQKTGDSNLPALQALLITELLFDEDVAGERLRVHWDKIYEATCLYVAISDDLTPHQIYSVLVEVVDEDFQLDDLTDKALINSILEKLRKLPPPRIAQQVYDDRPTGLQFRFMGQRFVPDSYALQKLSYWPNRPFPKGMDVMAVMGSQRAQFILDSLEHEPEVWMEYLPRRIALQDEFAAYDELWWTSSLYQGWLYTIESLLQNDLQEYPFFMQSQAWRDKSLTTSLASWAQLRHDAILYAKQSEAEGGNCEPEGFFPKGYVEPNPEFYNRLLKLMKKQRQVLIGFDGLPDRLTEAMDKIEDLVMFCMDIAHKELTNEALTREEFDRIRWIGIELERLSLRLVELDHSQPVYGSITGRRYDWDRVHLRGWYEVTGPARDIACIADVHTSQGRCLEVAAGHINTIYVIVPIEGQWHLTRGGVMSYYEFTYEADHRLDDEAWQEMLKRKAAPPPPAWTSSFLIVN